MMVKGKKGPRKRNAMGLPTIHPNVAAVDVGSTEHWVCCPPLPDGRPNVRVFTTVTKDLEELVAWLVTQGIKSVAMESTSVYWIPLYELLESGDIEAVLVNARHVRHVPGRKTDMQDCQWLQLLHRVGLLRGSFRPEDAVCRVRALQRQRANLVEEHTRFVHWMQKALDQMNVQVHRAVTDLTGKTGMSIVRAIVDGERDPQVLAAHRDVRCKKSAAEIAEYLTGTWRSEHLFNLQEAVTGYDAVEASIARYDEEIMRELDGLASPDRAGQPLAPHPNPSKEKALRRRGDQELRARLWRIAGVDLTHIDGISPEAAKVIFTEVGLDLSQFPDESHFVSWLCLAPHTPKSGGKPLKKRRRRGSGTTRVANILRLAAMSLVRSKTALGAAHRRVARNKNGAIANFATARRLAQLVFRMLRHGTDYVDLGQEAYEARFRERRLRGLTSTARELGFTLAPNEEAV